MTSSDNDENNVQKDNASLFKKGPVECGSARGTVVFRAKKICNNWYSSAFSTFSE